MEDSMLVGKNHDSLLATFSPLPDSPSHVDRSVYMNEW